MPSTLCASDSMLKLYKKVNNRAQSLNAKQTQPIHFSKMFQNLAYVLMYSGFIPIKHEGITQWTFYVNMLLICYCNSGIFLIMLVASGNRCCILLVFLILRETWFWNLVFMQQSKNNIEERKQIEPVEETGCWSLLSYILLEHSCYQP